jgi:2-haloacid dehalogenase
MIEPEIFVFDAYGTLFDVHSAVARHREAIGAQADRLSELWRTKQLEYTWTRSLMGAYRDFRALTANALDHAAARCGGLPEGLRQPLLEAYESLDAFPDVVPTLEALKAQGRKIAILSNGTPGMLASAIRSAGLAELIDDCLSVDEVMVYKTAPEAYRLVLERFGVRPGEVSFQSSNRWDVAGAARFGFHTVWINRGGVPDEYQDLPPTRILPGLSGLMT